MQMRLPQSQAKVWLQTFLKGLWLSGCLLCLYVFAFYITHSSYQIIGSSMHPTIASNGSSCFISPKNSYHRQDIVVSFDARVHTAPVIKRIIATGGDMVGFFTHPQRAYPQILLIPNGSSPILLEEEYLLAGHSIQTKQQILAGNIIAAQNFYSSLTIKPLLTTITYAGQQVEMLSVPKNEVFILGDNRAASLDSSIYGTIKTTCIMGKVDYIYNTSTPQIAAIIHQFFNF